MRAGKPAVVIYVYRYGMLVLYTIVWGVAALVIGVVDRSGEGILWVARNWIRWILVTCHIEIDCEGLENVDPKQPYVFMSNHQSVFDVPAIVTTIPVSWRFVAKKELLLVPFFGWGLGLGGHVIVDRGRHERAMRSMRAAAERIRTGTNVIIFPEGTRGTTGAMLPFKSGGFHLAIEAQVPILPVSISGSQHITPKGSLRIESGRIKIRYGKPIATRGQGPEDRDALKERVRSAILEGIDPARQAEPASTGPDRPRTLPESRGPGG
jgi:1-acyl-sn-glycerol-3-phosphate acyltransferase